MEKRAALLHRKVSEGIQPQNNALLNKLMRMNKTQRDKKGLPWCLRSRVMRAYLACNPAKVGEVDDVLSRLMLSGSSEILLFANLLRKYQPPKEVSTELTRQLHFSIVGTQFTRWLGEVVGDPSIAEQYKNDPLKGPVDCLRDGVLLCRVIGAQPRTVSSTEGHEGSQYFATVENVDRFCAFCMEQLGFGRPLFDAGELIEGNNDPEILRKLCVFSTHFYDQRHTTIPPPNCVIQETANVEMRRAFASCDPQLPVVLLVSEMPSGARTKVKCEANSFEMTLSHPLEHPAGTTINVSVLEGLLMCKVDAYWELAGAVIARHIFKWDHIEWIFPAPEGTTKPTPQLSDVLLDATTSSMHPTAQVTPVAPSHQDPTSPVRPVGLAAHLSAAARPGPRVQHSRKKLVSRPSPPPAEDNSNASILRRISPNGRVAKDQFFAFSQATLGDDLTAMECGDLFDSMDVRHTKYLSHKEVLAVVPALEAIRAAKRDPLQAEAAFRAVEEVKERQLSGELLQEEEEEEEPGKKKAWFSGLFARRSTQSPSQRDKATASAPSRHRDASVDDDESESSSDDSPRLVELNLPSMSAMTAPPPPSSGLPSALPTQSEQQVGLSTYLSARMAHSLTSDYLADETLNESTGSRFVPPPVLDIDLGSGDPQRRLRSNESIRTVRLVPHDSATHLGRGTFGTVYHGIDIETCRSVAVKLLPLEDEALDKLDQLQQEANMLARVQHENIVKCHGATLACQDKCLCIVMEFAAGGTVQQLMQRFQPMSPLAAIRIASQIGFALAHMHEEHHIVHCDLKPENILLRSDGTVVVADFGSTLTISPSEPSALVGTPVFLSPEVIAADEPDVVRSPKRDVWAFGCCIVQLFTGKVPWSHLTFDSTIPLMYHIASSKEMPYEEELIQLLPKQVEQAVRSCFERDHVRRKTMREVTLGLSL